MRVFFYLIFTFGRSVVIEDIGKVGWDLLSKTDDFAVRACY